MSTSPPPPSTDHHSGQAETFRKFFDGWLIEQNQHLQDLISAAKNQNTDVDALIDRVIQHYEHYYKVKSSWVKRDALSMLTPSWTSSLEDAFLWIGGWRPSTAFHLLYSKSGIQLEGRLMGVIRGLTTGDLGDLSPPQVVQIDSLQRQSIKEEKEITEKMAKCQETVADPSMVELSQIETEGEASEVGGVEVRLKSTLGRKEEALKEMIKKADELRLRTLKGILQILTKTQAVHFLIAAAALHLRIHQWGLQRDSKQQ